MTQDERRMERYTEVKTFIESNHRNPSCHNPEERFKYCNWLKHNKKLLNAGEMKECMTQDERWLARYNEVKSFIEENHRNPS